MKEWPKDNKIVSFSELTEPITKAIRHAYAIKRLPLRDIPWTGLELGKREKVNCFEPAEHLTAKNLDYSDQEQGRDALEEIVGIAVRLGIEQGRRAFRDEHEFQTMQHKLDMIRIAVDH